MSDIKVKVAGVTFAPGYPATFIQLASVVGMPVQGGEGLAAVLRRNPANTYDANAIEIHVPSIGQMIGHMPKELAARCAPHMDADVTFGCEAWSIDIDPDHRDRPGCTVRVWRVTQPTTQSRPEATNQAPPAAA